MNWKGRINLPGLAAGAVLAAGANIGAAAAQNAPAGMSVTAYEAATTMVQDPPGSAWQSVPTSSLPAPAAVIKYQQDQWVEIMDQGRPVRVNIMDVQVVNPPPPPGEKDCVSLSHLQTVTAGQQGLGGC